MKEEEKDKENFRGHSGENSDKENNNKLLCCGAPFGAPFVLLGGLRGAC